MMIRFTHLFMAFLIRHACQSHNEELTNLFKLRSARSATAIPKDKTILLILTLIFFGLLIFLTIICFYRKSRRKNVTQNKRLSPTVRYNALPQQFLVNTGLSSEESNEDLLERLKRLRLTYKDYRKNFEIHTSSLKVSNKKLGEGQYGCVHLGYLHKGDERLTVAVKRSNKPTVPYERRMFMAELTVMCEIKKHPNVLALIGGVTLKNRERIVMEFVDSGNLLGFLRKYKENITDGCEEVSTFKLISFAFQIANGMEHLAKIPCVHRDLAARNVLISDDGVTKIGDFGLSRKYENKEYYRPSNEDPDKTYQPWLWMAPEAFEEMKFKEKSDVWSFAVTLYEIFSLGKSLIGIGNGSPFWQTTDYLPKPEHCSDEIYEFMKLCWHKNPKNRPTFVKCREFFEEHLRSYYEKEFKDLKKKLEKVSKEQATFKSWAGIN